jgi:hypothetical protein
MTQFTIPIDVRKAVLAEDSKDDGSLAPSEVARCLQAAGMHVDEDDVEIVRTYGQRRHALGDIYDDIRAIEVELHRLLKSALEEHYGPEEDQWWREGVPTAIREKCGARRESEEKGPVPHAYCFTDLLDLRSIMNKRWTVIATMLPGELASNKQGLLADLMRVNEIRRAVMHPVRGDVPSEDDFNFLWSLRRSFGFDEERAVLVTESTLEQIKATVDRLPDELLDKVKKRVARC